MSHVCKHCASPYDPKHSVGEFCCAGCQQVYTLIQEEGFNEYYQWQDRSAEPLKDRELSDLDWEVFQSIQVSVEGEGALAQLSLRLEGMSCMGCVWLVERLARKSKGLHQVEVSLSRHLITLQWRPGAGFDLAKLGQELLRFGYRLGADPMKAEHFISPLTLRCVLTSLFTGNALLLALFDQLVGALDSGGGMVDLLSLLCLVFSLLLGASPFVVSAVRSVQIRRWHSDWVPSCLLICGLIFVLSQMLLAGLSLSWAAFLECLLVWILVSARWLGFQLSKR